jgi:hypothetical protein
LAAEEIDLDCYRSEKYSQMPFFVTAFFFCHANNILSINNNQQLNQNLIILKLFYCFLTIFLIFIPHFKTKKFMKRIYLSLLALFVTTSLFAQRSVNLSMEHRMSISPGTPVIIKDGDKIFINNGTEGQHPVYQFQWMFKCLGPGVNDTVMKSDKIKLYRKNFMAGPGDATSLSVHGIGGMGLNDSAYYTPTASSLTNSASSSSIGNIQWCDSIWLVDSPGNAIVADPAIANNWKCNTIEATVWAAGIENIEAMPNQLILYPNPATQKLTIKYNFQGLAKSAYVSILDVTGKELIRQHLGTNLSGTKDIPVNVSTLQPGMYFMQLKTEEGNTAKTKFQLQ